MRNKIYPLYDIFWKNVTGSVTFSQECAFICKVPSKHHDEALTTSRTDIIIFQDHSSFSQHRLHPLPLRSLSFRSPRVTLYSPPCPAHACGVKAWAEYSLVEWLSSHLELISYQDY